MQDWNVRSRRIRLDLAAELKAVNVGQIHVESNKVRIFAGTIQGFGASARFLHLKTGVTKRAYQRVANGLVVVNGEDSRRAVIVWRGRGFVSRSRCLVRGLLRHVAPLG